MSINNDHVIEAHYCQPGAKGITIFTADYGRVFIDFDKMEVQRSSLYVRRQTFLAHNETEEMGWYYKDNRHWYEYASPGSSSSRASVSSSDLEQQYSNHQRNFNFTVGNGSYSLDFRAMTQKNLTTGTQRKVRRRPKLNSVITSNSPAGSAQLPLTQPSRSPTGGGWKWQFKVDEGVWADYSSPNCSMDSDEIERCYQRNPQGQIQLKSRKFGYTLDFSAMSQTNNRTGTNRAVRRVKAEGQPTYQRSASFLNNPATPQDLTRPSSSGYTWEFMGDEGIWTEYQPPGCSISSTEIENIYQLNPQGQAKFTVGSKHTYTLDFAGMHQTNDILGTQRDVRRILKSSPQLIGYNPDAGVVRDTPANRAVLSPLHYPATPQTVTLSLPSTAGYTWEFMGDESMWTEYQAPSCSISSVEIENIYQLNPQGQAKFTAGRYSYTLDFTGMHQTNDILGTQRVVRRLLKSSPQLNGHDLEAGGVRGTPANSFDSGGRQCQWQYKDVEGAWKDFDTGGCNVSSQDIESSYQQNPSGTMGFSTNSFLYELDFSAMTQRNQSTQTTRAVRRLQE